jgi:hypothetical protein
MRFFFVGLLAFPAFAWGQNSIPAGTVLPAQLTASLDSSKNRAGQTISARVMQDVPLPAGKIPAGARITGRIVNAAPTQNGGAEISLEFDTVRFRHHRIAVTTNLRAWASMIEVEDAQIPSTGTDRGTTFAWMTTNQIGGEVVYGQGGPVTNGSNFVGHAAPGGVLVHLSLAEGSTCRGETDGNESLQALWLFSSDACGLYGFPDLQITHAGRTNPVGQIRIASRQGPIRIRGGSGLLLRVD